MNKDNMKDTTEWKFDAKRREKEERKQELGSAGDKKPIHEKGRRGRVLFPILATLLVIAILSWAVFALGLPQKYIQPVKVGQSGVSVAEYGYFYNSAYQQFMQYAQQGIVPSKDGKMDMNALTGLPKYEKLTWGEFLDVSTQEQIQRLLIMNEEAKKAGMTLSEENRKRIEEQIRQATKQFGSKVDAENALVKAYGRGVTLDVLRGILEKVMLAEQFGTEFPKSYEVSEADAQKYYEEHKDQFDTVSYRMFTLNLPAPGEEEAKLKPEEQQKKTEEDMAKLKESAELFLKGVHSEADFIARAKAYAPAEEKEAYADAAKTLVSDMPVSQLAGSTFGQWLKGDEAKPGATFLQSGYRSYQIYYFLQRQRPEMKNPTIGYLSFPLNAAPEKQDAAAQEAAKKAKEALLKTAEEAAAKVKDKASLEDVARKLQEEGQTLSQQWFENFPVSRMPEEQRNWLMDAARKEGDVKVFKNAQGAEVILFSKAGEQPAWLVAVENAIRNEKMNKDLEDWTKKEEYQVERNNLGMRFVDKMDKNTKTGAEVIAESEAAKAKETARPSTSASETSVATGETSGSGESVQPGESVQASETK